MLTVAGAAYLVWLGVGMLVRSSAVRAGADRESVSWVRQAVKGLGISGLNPKLFLLFFALLPQFVRPAAGWPVVAQIVALGLVHVASCRDLHRGRCGGATGAAGPAHGGAYGVPRFRRGDGGHRRTAADRADQPLTPGSGTMSR